MDSTTKDSSEFGIFSEIFTDVEMRIKTSKLEYQDDLIKDIVGSLISVTGFVLKLEPFFRCALSFETDKEGVLTEANVVFTVHGRHLSYDWVKRAVAVGMKRFGVYLETEIMLHYGEVLSQTPVKFELLDYRELKNSIPDSHPGVLAFDKIESLSPEFKENLRKISESPERATEEAYEFLDGINKLFEEYVKENADEGSIYA